MIPEETGINNQEPEDIQLLTMTLPVDFQSRLRELPLEQLLEVVMDLGRIPEARFPEQVVPLGQRR